MRKEKAKANTTVLPMLSGNGMAKPETMIGDFCQAEKATCVPVLLTDVLF
jgi:hypothetical protein